jgi:hypothetical protein
MLPLTKSTYDSAGEQRSRWTWRRIACRLSFASSPHLMMLNYGNASTLRAPLPAGSLTPRRRPMPLLGVGSKRR